jgi:transcriptional regulator with XRE-family HTH domain
VEKPINQRIKFLLNELGLSARDFSRAVGVPDNNTQNYLEPRFAQPKADYLEKVMLHFGSINPKWLLTGQGEPFLNQTTEPRAAYQNNSGNTMGNNNSLSSQTNRPGAAASTGAWRPSAPHGDLAAMEALIEQLRSQLADKERIIQLLEKSNK